MDEGDLELLDDNFEDGDGDGDGDGDNEEGVTYKEVEIREQDRCFFLILLDQLVFEGYCGLGTCQLQISQE